MSRLETLKLLQERGVLSASEKEELDSLLNQEEKEIDWGTPLYEFTKKVRPEALELLKKKDYAGVRKLYKDSVKQMISESLPVLIKELDAPYLEPILKCEVIGFNSFATAILEQDLPKDQAYEDFVKSCNDNSVSEYTVEHAVVAGVYRDCVFETVKRIFNTISGYEVHLALTVASYIGVTTLPIVITQMNDFMPERFKSDAVRETDLKLGLSIVHEATNEATNLLIKSYYNIFGSENITPTELQTFMDYYIEESNKDMKGEVEIIECIKDIIESLAK